MSFFIFPTSTSACWNALVQHSCAQQSTKASCAQQSIKPNPNARRPPHTSLRQQRPLRLTTTTASTKAARSHESALALVPGSMVVAFLRPNSVTDSPTLVRTPDSPFDPSLPQERADGASCATARASGLQGRNLPRDGCSRARRLALRRVGQLGGVVALRLHYLVQHGLEGRPHLPEGSRCLCIERPPHLGGQLVHRPWSCGIVGTGQS